MRKILFFLLSLMCIAQLALAQPATYSNPVGLGRNNSGVASGGNAFFKSLQDSVFFFNYQSPLLSPTLTAITGCQPVFKTNYAPLNTYNRLALTKNQPFSPYDASISFNPADQMIYYVWTDYNIAPPYKSYIWRWDPTTCPISAVPGLDTLRTFNSDIGGIVFDANGLGWQLEFSGTAPFQARLRPVNFATGVIGIPDTLDLTGGKKLYNVGTGDITLTPSGQMYFVFNNKLFTPDYGSYGGATKHITCTYIDTVKNPTGATGLPGLTFGNGDLIAAYSPGAPYRRIDGVTGDTNYISYGGFSPASKAVASFDMTAINSGVGSSKKLVSVTPTGTANQYDVVYDVFTKNFGNVPLTNVQVTDDLTSINGAANLSNVTAVFTSNPAGVVLNPGFNGNSNKNLLAAGQGLACYPVAINNFTIRISCRLSNILPGYLYNNSAISTANGFKNVALRDSSTNGSSPDLNQNDKTDDFGEGQPTPFIILLTPVSAPCTVVGNIMYNQDFGTGAGLFNTIPPSVAVPSASSGYSGVAAAPLAINKFTVTNNATNGDPSNWISLTDHTGGGRMMVVNADASASVIYRDTLPVACPGQQYSVSLYAAFIGNSTYQTVCNGLGGFKYPKFLISLIDLTSGRTVTQAYTTDITATTWSQYGIKFVMPPGYSNMILEIRNAGPGGCGNDVAIDDIQFGTCSAAPTVDISGAVGGCLGTSTTFNSSLSDPTAISGTIAYQWQVASALAGPYADIVGATSSTYTIPALAAADTGKYYRVIIAALGNIGTAGCQYISPGFKLTGLAPSVSPASVSITAPTICASGSTTLTAVGGTLGTGANYQWGTGSVVGTSPIVGATSSTLTVSPAGTTTYWVQIQNTTAPCSATTGGVTKVVTVNQPSTAPTSVSGADFCSPGSTLLTAAGGALGTGANYQWGTGSVVGTNPIVGATSSTLAVSPGSSTTYWVRIENTTAPCAVTTSGITRLVTVTQPSVAPTSVSATALSICGSGSTTLTALGGSLGTGANYQWGTGSVIGTNPIAGATSSTLTISPAGTTTYWVQIQNTSAPCSATTGGVTQVVTVNQPSTAPSSVTGADFCNPGSALLTAAGGALGTGANYQWGTGSVVGTSPIVGATSSTLTVSPSSSTTYWVRIENTTAPCAVTTSGITRLITVTQPSVSPTSVSATASSICGSGSTTLTAVGGTLGTGANYQWGTGSVVGTSPIVGATSSTLTVSPAGTTTYWVQIQNTTAPCSATTGGVTKVVTVNQPSTAPTSVSGADFCSPGSTLLTAAGGALGTGANYQWGTGSVIGTNPIIGATSSTLTVSPTSTTTYWIRIENTTAPCTVNTSGLTKLIIVTQSSVAAVSATKNKNNICPGISVSLGITGGTLGTGASWKWYTGSPGGTLIGTGATLSVTPLVTTTYYVRAEGSCNTTADQSVTVAINCNIDKDKDGIPDFVESNMAAAFADANSNGVSNAYDPTYAGFVDYNNDFINDNFQADGDSNNDGIPNYLDPTFPGRLDSNSDGVDDRFDTDKDGIINMLDLDSDNDGIPDVVEANGVDTGGDGLIDSYSDTDGDGLTQSVDINNTGAYNTGIGLGLPDFDGDGVPNFLDLDSDADGIPDIIEAGGTDINNNGMADGATGANGIPIAYTGAGALLKTGADINGDGKADSYPNKNLDRDFRPNAYDIDSDGDGIVDAIEAGGAITDTNFDGKADGSLGTNGWSTSVSGMIALNLRNTDGSGNPDYLDIDSDDDGIPDNIEGMSTASYIRPTSTADTDGDGLINHYDNFNGFGGSGIFVYDHDSDGTPDYRDLDTDSDGQPDIIEGNDFNLNGKPDDLVTLTGLDTDGDGLDNRFDSLNSVTNLKGTSYMMGTGGSFTGDATPGSRATVQRTFSTQTDRDWRFTSTVLPVQFLQFAGVPQDNSVLLSWTIITQKNIDRFEIERSLDNSVYQKTGVVSDPVKINEQQSLAFTDNIAGIYNDVIYYRLKVIAKTGESKYSNILVVRRIQTRSMVNIMPNPAYNYVNVNLYVEKNSQGIVTVIDKLGRRVMTQETKFIKGTNNIYLPLEKYAQGVYSIVIETSTEKIIRQLIIAR
ncbi:MAG: T9SS type A sorting domain-containing protein [Ferruginibacter sp.]